jgi:hypothetical protein
MSLPRSNLSSIPSTFARRMPRTKVEVGAHTLRPSSSPAIASRAGSLTLPIFAASLGSPASSSTSPVFSAHTSTARLPPRHAEDRGHVGTAEAARAGLSLTIRNHYRVLP